MSTSQTIATEALDVLAERIRATKASLVIAFKRRTLAQEELKSAEKAVTEAYDAFRSARAHLLGAAGGDDLGPEYW